MTGIQSIMGFGANDAGISRLAKKMISLSAAFFLLSSIGPLYYLTEGYHAYDEVDFTDYTDQETQSILENILSEDGFVLKRNINNYEGDRSTANEIFAYEVEPGDTLSSLAQQFGVKRQTIIMENNLWNVNSLRTGSTLKILPVDGISHLVKKGDTISKISAKYKVEEADIIRQNQLEEGETLLADTALVIPGGKRAVVAPKPSYSGKSSSGRYAPDGFIAPSNPNSYNYAGASTGRLIWPTLGSAVVTQGFSRAHYALDIANRARGPIFAAAAGRVVKASTGWSGGYGNYIIIDHGNGMQTLYAHNEKLYVSVGQYVEQGQTIAWMGRSGRVYGPTGIHVHFEVRINGVKYNPYNFL